MMDAFVAWWDRYRDRIEVFEFFAAGGGGFAVVKFEDEVALSWM